MILPKSFYERDPAIVARELLGKILVHKIGKNVVSGKIVETEAYRGEDDPACIASKGRKPSFEVMWDEPGKILVYMVHANWLFNIVCMPKGIPSAVLIRAVEPIEGFEFIKKRRKIDNILQLTNGPGKLTKAMNITKAQYGLDVTEPKSEIIVLDKEDESFEIVSSHRVGVSKDLPEELRFYIKNNPFVSKK